MRGAPLLQALILLLTLSILGYAGHRFIQMESHATTTLAPLQPPAPESSQVGAEIELTFSTPPKFYQLKYPSPQNTTETTLLVSQTGPQEIENPIYADVSIPTHQLTTYWLDVTWREAPAEYNRHFIKITLSPTHGVSRSFSFSTDSDEMNETFDYANAPAESDRHE